MHALHITRNSGDLCLFLFPSNKNDVRAVHGTPGKERQGPEGRGGEEAPVLDAKAVNTVQHARTRKSRRPRTERLTVGLGDELPAFQPRCHFLVDQPRRRM